MFVSTPCPLVGSAPDVCRKKSIDGITCQYYQTNEEDGRGTFTMRAWIDPATHLPVALDNGSSTVEFAFSKAKVAPLEMPEKFRQKYEAIEHSTHLRASPVINDVGARRRRFGLRGLCLCLSLSNMAARSSHQLPTPLHKWASLRTELLWVYAGVVAPDNRCVTPTIATATGSGSCARAK